MDSIRNKNALDMYLHPDGYYRSTKVSSLHMSWLSFQKIFKLVFNGFEETDGKKLKVLTIVKILSVGYVLFTLLGFLALLIALFVLANAGLGSLFFIFLGIGSSLLGIVAIGIIILGAVLRKNMKKTKIYVYSEMKNDQQNVLFAHKSATLSMEQKEYQACEITKDINTKDLLIPMSNVHSQKDFLSNSK